MCGAGLSDCLPSIPATAPQSPFCRRRLTAGRQDGNQKSKCEAQRRCRHHHQPQRSSLSHSERPAKSFSSWYSSLLPFKVWSTARQHQCHRPSESESVFQQDPRVTLCPGRVTALSLGSLAQRCNSSRPLPADSRRPDLAPTGPLTLGSCRVPGRPLRAWTPPHRNDHWAGSPQSDSPPPGSGVLICPPTPVIKFRPTNGTKGFFPLGITGFQLPMIPSSLPTSPWECVPLRINKINFHADLQWVCPFLPLTKPVVLKVCSRWAASASFQSLLEMQIQGAGEGGKN